MTLSQTIDSDVGEDEFGTNGGFRKRTQRVQQIGGWEYDPNQEKLVCDARTQDLLSVSSDRNLDIEGLLACFRPEDKRWFKQILWGDGLDELPLETDCRLSEYANEERWLHCRCDAFSCDQTHPIIHGTFRDVTDEKRPRSKLRPFKEAVEQTAHAVYITDPEGVIEYVNPAFESVTGYDESTILGETPSVFKSGEYGEDYYQALWKTISSGEQWQNEMINEDADGNRIVLNQTISPITNEAGNVEKYVVIAHDITERTQRETEVERQRDFLRQIQEVAQVGGWEVDLETGELSWTDQVYDIHGRPKDDGPTLQKAFDYYHSEDQPVIEEAYRRLVEHGEQYDLELRLITDCGEVRRIRTLGIPVNDESGNISRTRGVIRDVTRRKNREDALRRYKELVENVPVGIYRNTPGAEGGFLEVNPKMKELFEADSEEELLETKVSDLYVRPEQREEFSRTLRNKGFVSDYELKLKTLSGKQFWGSVTAIESEVDGEIVFDGIIEDITHRRRMNERIKSERDRLESIISLQERIMDSDLDLAETTDLIAREIRDFTDADGVRILTDQEEELVNQATIGQISDEVIRPSRITSSFADRGDPKTTEAASSVESDGDPISVERAGENSSLYVPLLKEDEQFGVIEIYFDEKNPLDRVKTKLLKIVAGLLSSSLYQALQKKQKEKYLEKVEELATTDQLTELANRRVFFRRLGEAVARAERNDRDLSLALLDLDHFKRVNDRFGHRTGDRVLESIAEILENEVRSRDTVARYGGEEFALLFPETSLDDARSICHRVLSVLRKHTHVHEGTEFTVTCSLGLAEYRDDEDAEVFLNRVDDTLYRAKESGRDQLAVD